MEIKIYDGLRGLAARYRLEEATEALKTIDATTPPDQIAAMINQPIAEVRDIMKGQNDRYVTEYIVNHRPDLVREKS